MMSLTEEERCNVRMKNAEGSKRQYKLFRSSAHLKSCKVKNFVTLLCDGDIRVLRLTHSQLSPPLAFTHLLYYHIISRTNCLLQHKNSSILSSSF